jgi:hypothetical protein
MYPLRAVILDNDETTGSYVIVFSILQILRCCKNKSDSFVKSILNKLYEWMILHNCFRPGLRNLLETLIRLRKNNQIEAIIMYTNQLEFESPNPDESPLLFSAPKCIAYMMSKMVGENVFDHILTRPQGPLQKRFERILNLYPEYPRDIRDITFIDDLATPCYITAFTIPKNKIDESSWYKVEPYHKIFSHLEVMKLADSIFENNKEITNAICIDYLTNVQNISNSTPNATPFLKLCEFLKRRYILV